MCQLRLRHTKIETSYKAGDRITSSRATCGGFCDKHFADLDLRTNLAEH